MDMEKEEDPLVEGKKTAGAGGRWGDLESRRVLIIIFLFSLTVLFVVLRVGWSSTTAWHVGDGATVDRSTIDMQKKKLLGGLLSPDFDEQSCVSRYQSSLYRKPSPYRPSSYLAARLRQYEALHKKCGPNTLLYNKTVELLKSDRSSPDLECNYVLWTPFNGLGNRIFSLVSAFLYALLTNRVLLIHETPESLDLFCEPFPGTSWILPSDNPVNLRWISGDSPVIYGNMVRNNTVNSAEWVPPYVYLSLLDNYRLFDGLFFCDNDQSYLNKVNWIVVHSDLYFLPNFFLCTQHKDELQRLFPAKDTVFHHLGRYLFHPTNTVWGLVTRYYDSYLAKADERIGLQVRTFRWPPIYFEEYQKQLVSCYLRENLLPNVTNKDEFSLSRTRSTNTTRSKAVLVVSLFAEYFEQTKSMYYEHSTVNGEVISVFQPTHEETQQTEKYGHNQKALAEIYLLSLVDVLVTSSYSTFGYVGQGLGGLTPWILLPPWDQKAAGPPCRRALSMEPCSLKPFMYDCKAKKEADLGTLAEFITHCEDDDRGVKLVNKP